MKNQTSLLSSTTLLNVPFIALALVFSLISLALSEPLLNITTTKIRPDTEFNISFDRAVVEQETVSKVIPNNILTITPKWSGKIKWTSTNTVKFLPDVAPEMNASYAFNLVGDIKHLDGSAIEKTHLRMIPSEEFKSTYSRTFSSFRHSRTLVTYLRFNDDISPATAQKHLSYRNKKGQRIPAKVRQATWLDLKNTYYIKPSWKQAFDNNVLKRSKKEIPTPRRSYKKSDTLANGIIVTPQTPFPVGKDWTLLLSNGALNQSNTHKTLTSSAFKIGSLAPFKVNSIHAISSTGKARSINIYFNSTLPKLLTHEQMAPFIEVHPTPADLKFIRSSSGSIQATGSFYDHNDYKVAVKKDFKAANELLLDHKYTQDVEFKYVNPSVSLPSFSASQLSKGQRKYTIHSVNMQKVEVKAKLLNKKQAIRAYQGYAHYSSGGYNSKDTALPYDLMSGTTVYQHSFDLNNPIDTKKEINFSWNDVLPTDTENAVVFLAINASPKKLIKGKVARPQTTQSIIQLTDIGLAWKIAKDKIWIYAYSCQTGQPLENVKISLYGADAAELNAAQTDAYGLCELERNKQKEKNIVASLGKDTFITSLDRSISTVSMWRFPINFDYNEVNYWNRDALIFSDRSLYKPSETVRIKGVLREAKDTVLRLPTDASVDYTIFDNQYKVMRTGTLPISAQGSFDLSYQLPAEKVGTYRVVFEFDNQEDNEETGEQDLRRKSFTHRFHVQEFRRNAFEITTHLPQPEPAAEVAQLDLDAKYYQGTPISEGKLKWYFSATPTGFYPKKFRDFQFGDHRAYDPYYWSYYFGYEDNSSSNSSSTKFNGNAELNADGSASVKVDIAKPKFPSPQRISFQSEVTDSRSQTLSKTTSKLVHPASHYYGISRIDKLVRVGKPIDLNFVHIDLKGNYSQLKTRATLKIQREFYDSVRTTDSAGRESVKNEKRTEDISSSEIEITGDKPNTVPFNATKPGKYILTLSGKDAQQNLTATAISFYVYGKKEYPWATEDGIRIKLVAEKKSYRAGETARILVMTPIEGTALVTVERQGVSRHYRRELKTDNPVIEVPVEAGDAPNAFISVLIIRGSNDSKRAEKEPALKLGICEINVEDKTKKLNVALEVVGEYHRPGDDIKVNGKLTDHTGAPVANAEITLYAEDEGVLAVMGYRMPKPLAHFYRPKPLTVTTGVSLGYFISEDPQSRYFGNKGFVIGDAEKGGDDALGMNENINLKLRKNFDPCAFWMPTITTAADGTFSITSSSPDTLTRYRIMAIATSGSTLYGSAKSSVVVSKDIMLEPSAPRFAHEGDALTTKVLVQNNSEYTGQWDISLTTTGGITQLAENSSGQSSNNSNSSTMITIKLAPGDSATLDFPVIFTDTGETRWIWAASPRSLASAELNSALSLRLSDSMESKFKVHYPRPLLKHSETITMNNDRRQLFGKVDPRLLGGRGKARLDLSNSLLLEASGAFNHLLKYPYGCVEQTTSSMMPWFAVNDLRHIIPSFQTKTDKEVLKAIQKGADRLLTMQTSSGGLAYWPNGDRAEIWASSYGAMGLVMAKQAGAKVPEHSMSALLEFLKDVIKDHPIEKQNSWENESDCRALYVLALAKSVEPSVINVYYEKRKLLSHTARTFLALAIHHSGGDKKLAIELLNDTSKLEKKEHWMVHRADKALTLLAWSNIDPKNPVIDQTLSQIIKGRNKQGHWSTTWVNGWTLNSMASYARNVESQRDNITITIGGTGASRDITLTKDNPTQSIELTLDEAKQLRASSDSRAYAKVYVESKPKLIPAGAESHNGVQLKRSYKRINDKGEAEPLTNPRVGDLVQVDLTVSFPRSLHYVVIDDALPSIMETVNGDFASQKTHIKDPSKNNWNISRRELRSNRALFFLNRSWTNKPQTISYLARITSEGTVHTPAGKVEAMYDPSTYALTDSNIISSEK